MQNTPVNIGSRRELFVDDCLVDRLDNARLILQRPQEMPGIQGPSGAYMTVIHDGDRYRAYYRETDPDHRGPAGSGERTCHMTSDDGIRWDFPDLGTAKRHGLKDVIPEIEPPFTHNFSPFLDRRDGIREDERFKALAGMSNQYGTEKYGTETPTLPTAGQGLHAFVSSDGIHWHRTSDRAVIPYNPELHGPNAFDSQNVAFWSEAEQCYVAYFRHMKTPEGVLRTVSRATSLDFVNWRDESATFTCPNLPGEELYTTQTHPYFRAPHMYIALPTRFAHGRIMGDSVEGDRWGTGNVGSTDTLFMTMRAGSNAYQRTFKEAFIRPGPNPARWGNRANYMALNIVPTGSAEMSLYHGSGARYVLRTDGFASVNAPWSGGELLTQPLVFSGRELALNYSTSIAGRIVVEIQDAAGVPIPGYTLDDCPEIIGDEIERVVTWKRGTDLGALAGRPVRLRFVMKDADLFALQFR